MKEQYMKQVERELSVTRKRKKEIARDLEEAFSSALEHGETEAAVIERLGTPKEFSERMEEQLGGSRPWQKEKRAVHIGFMAVCAAVLFGVYSMMQLRRTPAGIIGQADAMTAIQIEALVEADYSRLILLAGILACIVAAALAIDFVRKKGKG